MLIGNEYNRFTEMTTGQSNHVASKKELEKQQDHSVEVALSNTSQQLRSADLNLSKDNSQKIAEIKKAIQAGTYKVSATKLTDKMAETFNKQKE